MVLSMLLVVANSARANELVLIGTTAGPWQPLSAFELRKMYMGLPVSRDGTPLTPLRNSQSQEITQLFHNVIVGMHANAYKRKLLRNQMNYAIVPPHVEPDFEKLSAILRSNPYAVSFTWRSTLGQKSQDIKVLQVIWRDAE